MRLSSSLAVAAVISLGALATPSLTAAQACGYHKTHTTADGSFQVPKAPWPSVLMLGGGLFVAGTTAALWFKTRQHRQTSASLPEANTPHPEMNLMEDKTTETLVESGDLVLR